VTDLARLSIYERTERIEEALMGVFEQAGYVTGTDWEGRYFLKPKRNGWAEFTIFYLEPLARQMERELFP